MCIKRDQNPNKMKTKQRTTTTQWILFTTNGFNVENSNDGDGIMVVIFMNISTCYNVSNANASFIPHKITNFHRRSCKLRLTKLTFEIAYWRTDEEPGPTMSR